MKNLILAAFAVLTLSVGVANAAATNNHAPAPVQQDNQFSSAEGGWG